MATERYIHGKQDNSNHDGRYASVHHLAETDEEVIEFWEEVWPELKNYVLYGDAKFDHCAEGRTLVTRDQHPPSPLLDK